jgi:uncharacterized protein involved in exopolysaccharide biosynthesis
LPAAGEARQGAVIRQELRATFRRMRPALVWVCAGIMLLSVAASMLMQPAYRSDSDLMVLLGAEYGYRSQAGDVSAVNAAFDHDEMLGTEIGILSSRDLHRDVLAALGPAALYPRRGWFGRGGGDPVARTLPVFEANVSVLGDRTAPIIHLSFQHPDPAMAQKALQTLQTLYLARRRRLFADRQSLQVDADAERLRQALGAAEAQLAAFKARNGITNFGTRQDILLHEQGEVERDLAEARSLISQDQARLAALKAQLAAAPALTEQARDSELELRLASLRSSLEDLRARREALAAQYRASSEPVRAADAQIRAREAQLSAAFADRRPGTIRMGANPLYVAARGDQARVAADLRAAEARAARDGATLADLGLRIAALTRMEQTLADLERARQVADDGYREAARVRDARVMSEQVALSKQGDVRVIKTPNLPVAPESSRKLLLLAGVLASGMAALGMVVVGNFLRRDFVLAESLEVDCGIPVLAVVPEVVG